MKVGDMELRPATLDDAAFAADVRTGAFPEAQHTYAMPDDELAAFSAAAGAVEERVRHD